MCRTISFKTFVSNWSSVHCRNLEGRRGSKEDINGEDFDRLLVFQTFKNIFASHLIKMNSF